MHCVVYWLKYSEFLCTNIVQTHILTVILGRWMWMEAFCVLISLRNWKEILLELARECEDISKSHGIKCLVYNNVFRNSVY